MTTPIALTDYERIRLRRLDLRSSPILPGDRAPHSSSYSSHSRSAESTITLKSGNVLAALA